MAVKIIAIIQLGQTLDDASLDELEAFMGALTGAIPGHFSPPQGMSFVLPEDVQEEQVRSN
ncbi:MAG: hypothetical protein A3H44_09705 [Gammaproteobacteria bacterium RIFCSPLOWO2_02_FULL_57_10]|nr:MAG: hypothetical protein A3H44_09705 [Gammaproteobacteria bacterium RIFCSPLOWO2_02_FULL_57_10]